MKNGLFEMKAVGLDLFLIEAWDALSNPFLCCWLEFIDPLMTFKLLALFVFDFCPFTGGEDDDDDESI